MTPVFFTFDVIKLRVSPEEHHYYTGYKYNEGPLYSTFDEAKTGAVKVALEYFHAREKTVNSLINLTVEQLAESNTASFSIYITYVDGLGTKTDVILTVRALAADSDAKIFYTYHLAALSVPPGEYKRRFYDNISVKHGTMYTKFEAVKSAVIQYTGKENNYPELHRQVWGMSKDVTNIGRWRKGFREYHNTGFGVLQELRLDVFRVQIETQKN